jgi:predicted nuclease of restriction endonuclease-like (RecB) superfamily
MSEISILNKEYAEFFQSLKARISTAQVKAALAVNSQLVLLYWQIGRDILERQEQQGWGAKVVDQLSKDLRSAFPEMKGFSTRNLKYMRKFAEFWSDEQFVQQAAAQIPWFHNCVILDKLETSGERKFYIRETIKNGWSRNVLVWQIESKLFERQGKAVTNFELTLPKPQSDLAHQLLKDPYNFDFLTLHDEAVERDLEKELIANIQKFLLELGVGFAFVGSQYHLEIGGQDFYIDLLFYHLNLRCFVVIDLKMVEFKPEFAGKMNFYLSAVDDLLKNEKDEPSIGLILCKSKNRFIAEYTLRDMKKPIGVSEMQILNALPENLKGSLPTIEEIEKTASEVYAKRINSIQLNKDEFLEVVKAREKIGDVEFHMENYIPILCEIFEGNRRDEREATWFRLEALANFLDKEEFPTHWVFDSDKTKFMVIEPVFIVASQHYMTLEKEKLVFEKDSFFERVKELIDSEYADIKK